MSAGSASSSALTVSLAKVNDHSSTVQYIFFAIKNQDPALQTYHCGSGSTGLTRLLFWQKVRRVAVAAGSTRQPGSRRRAAPEIRATLPSRRFTVLSSLVPLRFALS